MVLRFLDRYESDLVYCRGSEISRVRIYFG